MMSVIRACQKFSANQMDVQTSLFGLWYVDRDSNPTWPMMDGLKSIVFIRDHETIFFLVVRGLAAPSTK
jgi:hypothetical protein